MPKVYGFNDRETAEALASMVRRAPRRVRKPTVALRPPVAGGGGGVIHFRSKAGGIPAKVNQQMGSAVCDIFTPSGTGVLTDSQTDETIWNMASTAFAANANGVAYKDDAGLLIAIVEDCGG